MYKWLSLFILVLSFQAKAGVFVEPFLGYDQSTLKVEASGISSGSTSSGVDYGLKLGYAFHQGFWLGVDYTGGSGTTKSDTAGVDNTDYSKTAIGALVGYSAGRFNFWAGYGFSDKVTVKSSGSPDTEMTGTNMKIGAGVLAVNHVAINLDYVIPKYTKSTTSGTESNISDTYSKFDTSGFMLSVSFPFDLTK